MAVHSGQARSQLSRWDACRCEALVGDAAVLTDKLRHLAVLAASHDCNVLDKQRLRFTRAVKLLNCFRHSFVAC
ncbi:hypothetical protein HYQ46_004033 [Verticillium longisporum]|nr:hypothetical protein HYQ46_004033 [Verticillium longisporum]